MHKQITILALFFAMGNAMAQEADVKPELSTEVGIQANALFGRLVPNAESNLVQNPYLLTAKLALGNLAIRTGFGGSHSKEIQKVDGFANSITNIKQKLDLRLGLERRFSLGDDRWQGSLGVDAIANWTEDKSINDSGFDVITDTRDIQYIGGGFAVGIKYKVTKRLSFCTEGYLYYTVGTITDGQFFKNFPVGEDKITKSETSAMQIGLPSSLYLVFEF